MDLPGLRQPGATATSTTAGYNSGNGTLSISVAVYAAPAFSGENLVNLPAAHLFGALPALNGSALTNLNAANLASGTIPDARFPTTLPPLNGSALTNLNAASLTGALPALNGSALTNLSAANLAGTLPALNGSALTNLNAANLTGALPALNGSALTNLNAANLSAGTVPDARFPTTLPALNGSALTNLNAANLTGALPALNGSALTNLTITETDPKVGTLSNGTVPGWNSGTSKLEPTALYSNAGKIGIGTFGTSSPATALHVSGSGDQEISIESTTTGGRRWTLQSNPSSNTLRNSFQIIDRTAGASRLGIDSAGQVGIGTSSPTAKLEVIGTAKASDLVSATASISTLNAGTANITTLNANAWASQSATANGYVNMGGIIIQWGTVSYTSSNGIGVAYPVVFPNAVFSLTATVNDAGGGTGGNVPCKTSAITNNGFTLGGTQVFNNDNSTKVKWMAIGR